MNRSKFKRQEVCMAGASTDALEKSLTHSVWDCKYHIVWIPKYRKKVLYGELRQYLGQIPHDLSIFRIRKPKTNGLTN
jgi:hypothetical protein